MDQFLVLLELEKIRLEKQVSVAEKKLSVSPEGSLSVRRRKQGISYYRNVSVQKGAVRKRKQINITLNQNLVIQLTEKLMQRKILVYAKCNLLYLKKLISHYHSTSPDEVQKELGNQYQQALKERKLQRMKELREKPYPKAPFNPKYHVHETDCGELVRSKSEQIILNTLTGYDEFVCHYEEEFVYSVEVEGLKQVYPDFTIILPDGRRVIWEHFGRLDEPEYCYKAALKLCLYQQNGYVIGENLIITMDDKNGNVSSSLILQAIQQQILAKIS